MQGLGPPYPPMSLRLERGCLDRAWVQVLGIYRSEGQGLARAVNCRTMLVAVAFLSYVSGTKAIARLIPKHLYHNECC